MANVAVAASDSNDGKEDHGSVGWIKDQEMMFRINVDPVLRTIVCRIAYTEISPKILSKAVRTAPGKLMGAIIELERMGLVKRDPQHRFDANIVPASNSAREKMRRWADAWCTSDDKCDVAS